MTFGHIIYHHDEEYYIKGCQRHGSESVDNKERWPGFVLQDLPTWRLQRINPKKQKKRVKRMHEDAVRKRAVRYHERQREMNRVRAEKDGLRKRAERSPTEDWDHKIAADESAKVPVTISNHNAVTIPLKLVTSDKKWVSGDEFIHSKIIPNNSSFQSAQVESVPVLVEKLSFVIVVLKHGFELNDKRRARTLVRCKHNRSYEKTPGTAQYHHTQKYIKMQRERHGGFWQLPPQRQLGQVRKMGASMITVQPHETCQPRAGTSAGSAAGTTNFWWHRWSAEARAVFDETDKMIWHGRGIADRAVEIQHRERRQAVESAKTGCTSSSMRGLGARAAVRRR